MAARKLRIDLLLRKDFSQKSAGRLLLWVLTVGRYIAIFTELVVIAGVIARFTLDYQRNRITEDIIEQQAILASYRPTELKIRRIDEQLTTISQLEDGQLEVSEMFEKLSSITPVDLRLESLKFNHEVLEISGTALSSQGLSLFLSGLQSVPDFEDIILKSIETGGQKDPTIHFVVSIELSGVAPQIATVEKKEK